MARRDDREYREYLREKQRRQPGCPARELCREPRGQDTRMPGMSEAVRPSPSATAVELIWEHDLVLAGKSGNATMTLDSRSAAGPSPMQALAFALAGCMAMDVVHVLTKGRNEMRGLRADLTGTRAA